jgi:predicted AlkP superfamily phosphohydrolase/phosphomutase
MSHILKTLIIGLDGADLGFIHERISAGELPNLKKLIADGASAKLRSTPAFTSAAAWSAIITGKNPGKNRVFDWMNKRPGGGFVESIVSSTHREGNAFWQEYEPEIRSAIIHVPCTYPPQRINGLMISGQGHPPKADAVISYPDSLLNELPPEHSPYVSEYVELENSRKLNLNVEQMLELFFRAEDRRTRLTLHLCEKQNIDVCMIVYTSTDQFGHSSDDGFVAKARAYGNCDKNVGLLIENLTGPDTTVIVISDHGIVPIRRRLNFWKLFRDNGLISRPLGVDLYTVVPHSVCGSLIIKVRGRDRRGIVKPSDYERTRERIIAILREARDEKGEPLFSNIRTREELYTGPYVEEAPDLNYELADEHTQVIFKPVETGAPYIETHSPKKSLSDTNLNKTDTGIHSRDGIFIARGPHIPAGTRIKTPMIVYDVAPIILYSLGRPIPTDMDGRVPDDLFESGRIKTNQPQFKESDSVPRDVTRETDEPAYSEEEEELIKKRLEDLGYL